MGVQVVYPGAPQSTQGSTAGSTPVNLIPATPASGTAAVNTAVTLTIVGAAGLAIRICALSGSYNAAPTGGVLTVVVNGVTILQADITAAGLFTIPLPDGGLECAAGFNAVITLSAAGAAVAGRLNVASFTGA